MMLGVLTVLAQYITPQPQQGGALNLPGATGGVFIETPVVNVINWSLLVAGGVAILILIISGFFYVTAAGNERALERAKLGIRGAITGLIIMMLAAIIVNTINYAITRNISSGGAATGSSTDLETQCTDAGGLYVCDTGGTNCRCNPSSPLD